MFRLKANPTFEWPVLIPSPNGEQTLTLIFKHKTRDEMKAYFEEASKGETDDAATIMGIVEGWKDVDAEFSEAAVRELTQNYFGAVPAIFDAYVAGLTQSKAKN